MDFCLVLIGDQKENLLCGRWVSGVSEDFPAIRKTKAMTRMSLEWLSDLCAVIDFSYREQSGGGRRKKILRFSGIFFEVKELQISGSPVGEASEMLDSGFEVAWIQGFHAAGGKCLAGE